MPSVGQLDSVRLDTKCKRQWLLASSSPVAEHTSSAEKGQEALLEAGHCRGTSSHIGGVKTMEKVLCVLVSNADDVLGSLVITVETVPQRSQLLIRLLHHQGKVEAELQLLAVFLCAGCTKGVFDRQPAREGIRG